MTSRLLAASLPLLLAVSTPLSAQSLLLDVNQGTDERSSAPRHFTEAGGWIYFFAIADRQSGHQLHRTQGTVATTEQVVDLGAGAIAVGTTAQLQGAGGHVFFRANRPELGTELWVSDGSAGGTHLLLDIVPGSDSSAPEQLVDAGGQLYFVAEGNDLWTSDGTTQGTQLVRSFPGSFTGGIEYLTYWNGSLYFSAPGPGVTRVLWKSDGTFAGSVELTPGLLLDPRQLTPGDSKLYFHADQTGWLWVSDGTLAGTTQLVPVAANWYSRWATLGDTLVFSTLGNDVWKSDGTVGGTSWLATIDPDWTGPFAPGDMVELGGKVYFSARDDDHGLEIWESDGSMAGTGLAFEVAAGPYSSNPDLLQELNGRLYFTADDGTYHREVWTSDGTQGGTQRLTSLNAGGAGTGYELHGSELFDELYFDSPAGGLGTELWKTDAAGATQMVADVQEGTNDSDPEHVGRLGDVTLFAATSEDGRGLWRTDGTTEGTYCLTELVDGFSVGGGPAIFAARSGGEVFFAAYDTAHGRELWKSDGTVAGTVLVKDIVPGTTYGHPSEMTSFRGKIYFAARDASNVSRLWSTDGTAAGTGEVLGVQDLIIPSGLYVYRDDLYFSGTSSAEGNELWKLDPSATSASLVVDLHPGPGHAFPRVAGECGQGMVLQATSPATGREPWICDGTAAGTGLLKDIQPGSGSSNMYDLVTMADGSCTFAASDAAHGLEPWRTDGTPGGTYRLLDVYPGPVGGANSTFSHGGRLGRFVFFSGRTPLDGTELWRTDGTISGTELVADLAPGEAGGAWDDFRVAGQSRLYLPVTSGTGEELWQVESGGAFRREWDLWPGPLSSSPEPLGTHRGALLVSVEDAAHGRELWILEPAAGVEPVGVGCGTATRTPQLCATTPELGRTWRVTAKNGAPGAPVMVHLGDPIPPVSIPGRSCETFLDPGTATVFAGTADGDGSLQLWIPIAEDPALVDFHFACQAQFLPTMEYPETDHTNGLYATIGVPDVLRKTRPAPAGGPQ